MAKEKELQTEYVEINQLISEMVDNIRGSVDDGQRELYIRQLEMLERIRRENYTEKDEKADKFERKLKIIKVCLDLVGIVVPVVVSGVGIYVARQNLMNLLEYELSGHVTSAAGKVLIPKALK